jgi:transposase-like protein
MELGPLILQNGANEDHTIYRRTVHRILKKAEVGMSIKDICRSGGLKQSTFYKWRSRFGGMEAWPSVKPLVTFSSA